jgi:glycerophosphoryl diester phosphodiesterase
MNPADFGPTRVYGHRGSPRRALENTLESFDRAEAEGADGFELDVRLTFDGEAVVHHDPDLVRGDRRVALSSLPLLELRQEPVRRGEFSGDVPTLREVFSRYGGQVSYLVELKSGPSPRPSLLEFRVAALLAQFHLTGKALVLSFSTEILRRIREIEPRIETCLVFDGTAYRPEGQLWPDLPKGCRSIAPQSALASERLLAEARAAEIPVHVWTVNDPVEAARFASLGAASVITDVPAEVVPAVRSVSSPRPSAPSPTGAP